MKKENNEYENNNLDSFVTNRARVFLNEDEKGDSQNIKIENINPQTR